MDKLKKGLIGSILISVILAVTLTYVWATTPTTTFYISTGVYPGAPQYTIWTEGTGVSQAYYAKRYDGYIPTFSGSTNGSYVIQSSIDATVTLGGGEVFVRVGIYNLTRTINLHPKVDFVGESCTYRDVTTAFWVDPSFTASTPMFQLITTSSSAGGGSLQNVYLYNPLMASKKAFGVLLKSSSTTSISDFHIFNLKTCYIDKVLHLDGFITRNTFRDINSVGFNAGFTGDYYVKLENTVGAVDRPTCNMFDRVSITHLGTLNYSIYLDGAYNTFISFEHDGGTFTECVIKTVGFYNRFIVPRIMDVSGVTTHGILYFSGKNGTSNIVMGAQLPFNNLDEQIVLDGNASMNHIEVASWAEGYLYVNATGAGADNLIYCLAAQNNKTVPPTFRILHTGEKVIYDGYGTHNSGSHPIGAGANTSCVFNHGLAATPTVVFASFADTGYGTYDWSATATQITITIQTSVATTVYWEARYQP